MGDFLKILGDQNKVKKTQIFAGHVKKNKVFKTKGKGGVFKISSGAWPLPVTSSSSKEKLEVETYF